MTAGIRALWQRNLVTLAMLKRNLPTLKSDKDQHYADILTSLYKRRLREMHEEAPRRQGRSEKPGTEENLDTDGRKETRSAAAPATVGQEEDIKGPSEGRDSNEWHSSSEIKPGTGEMMGTARTDAQNDPVKADGTRAQIERPAVHGKTESRSALDQDKLAETKSAPGQIDKSALPISAPRRIRDKEHLRYVAQQPCLICGRSPGHAHHLRFAQPRALGRKVSDEWVVPLCAIHHRALHGVGDEKRWWKDRGIDPIGHARILWWTTRFGNVADIDNAPSPRVKAQGSNLSPMRD